MKRADYKKELWTVSIDEVTKELVLTYCDLETDENGRKKNIGEFRICQFDAQHQKRKNDIADFLNFEGVYVSPTWKEILRDIKKWDWSV